MRPAQPDTVGLSSLLASRPGLHGVFQFLVDRCRSAVGAAAWDGEEALQPVLLLVRRATARRGSHIALLGLCGRGA